MAGLTVSFVNESNKVEKHVFQGGNWAVSSFSPLSGANASVTIPGDTITQELKPNTMYVFGTVKSLTVTFASEVPGIVNEYMFQFASGTTSTVLSLPAGVKWISEHLILSNTTYQVSIVNYLAVMGGAS